MSKLIGLIGQARVGKDTVGEILRRDFGFGTRAFADPIKDMLEHAFFGVNFRGGNREAEIPWLGKSPRHLMQTLGTEWGRDLIHPDLWVILAEQWIESMEYDNAFRGIVLTDVRFRNEADMVLRRGGTLWRITRDNAQSINEHRSEAARWDDVPHRLIQNNGSIEHLKTAVHHLMEEIQ